MYAPGRFFISHPPNKFNEFGAHKLDLYIVESELFHA